MNKTLEELTIKFYENEELDRNEALETDWAGLNRMTRAGADYLKYYGNYMPDGDSTEVYAVFGNRVQTYCVKIG